VATVGLSTLVIESTLLLPHFLFQGCHFQVHSHARRSKATCWQIEVSQCGLPSVSTQPESCVFYNAGPRRVGPWRSSGRTLHLQSYCALTRCTTCSMTTMRRVCGQAPHEESPVPSDRSWLPLIYDRLIAPTALATKWQLRVRTGHAHAKAPAVLIGQCEQLPGSM